jgi:hypothetical protein
VFKKLRPITVVTIKRATSTVFVSPSARSHKTLVETKKKLIILASGYNANVGYVHESISNNNNSAPLLEISAFEVKLGFPLNFDIS